MPKRFDKPIAEAPISDPQRELLYRVELELFSGWCRTKMGLNDARSFARAVCTAFKLPPVTIIVRDLGRWSGEYDSEFRRITLSPTRQKARSQLTLAHELAHHLHEIYSDDETQEWHGPQFMLAYMHILDRTRMIPLEAMEAVCDRRGLKYISPTRFGTLAKLKRAMRQ
jgi:hypothetical protein